ncbi:hypothetical protein [Kribbella amoyensis]|uniref:hypothetical protein n=1 Tax=Kribbella amoyensis TaxID=996641 RepID=UPI0011A01D50|nr:hypothetical protein [Kribbella amoyensis]
MALTRARFIEELNRLASTHPSLLWSERIIEYAPEVSDFVLTTDGPVTIVVSVRDDLDVARVMVDEHVFDFVPTVELHDFLAAVFSGRWEVLPKRGILTPGRMVVRSGERLWES